MNFINLQTFQDDFGNSCDYDKTDYKNNYQWLLDDGLSLNSIYLGINIFTEDIENSIKKSYSNFKNIIETLSKYSLDELYISFDVELLIEKLEKLEKRYEEIEKLHYKKWYFAKENNSLMYSSKSIYLDVSKQFNKMGNIIYKLKELIRDYPKYLSFCEDYLANSFYSFVSEKGIDSAIEELNTKLKTLDRRSREYFHYKGEIEALYEYKIIFTKSHCGIY